MILDKVFVCFYWKQKIAAETIPLYWQAATHQRLDILRHRNREAGQCVYQFMMDEVAFVDG
ncbi:hypothetical protein LJC33_08395 [Eubacteriales bacterium OttesenSCG-928-N13]|nr:hypothetical protein [Eubacteriales bacterium OttesenSCG-928-N13]